MGDYKTTTLHSVDKSDVHNGTHTERRRPSKPKFVPCVHCAVVSRPPNPSPYLHIVRSSSARVLSQRAVRKGKSIYAQSVETYNKRKEEARGPETFARQDGLLHRPVLSHLQLQDVSLRSRHAPRKY